HRIGEDCAVWKDLEECCDHAPDRIFIALIELDPLGYNSTRLQVVFLQLEILFGVERRRTFDPLVQRIRSDAVKLLLRGLKKMTAIIDKNVHLGILSDFKVVAAEPLRHDLRDERFY